MIYWNQLVLNNFKGIQKIEFLFQLKFLKYSLYSLNIVLSTPKI